MTLEDLRKICPDSEGGPAVTPTFGEIERTVRFLRTSTHRKDSALSKVADWLDGWLENTKEQYS